MGRLVVVALLATVAGDLARLGRCSAAERDVTFVITSDPHYRLDAERVEANRLTVEEINAVTERTWPDRVGGGPIAAPRGVLVPGDLVDDGDKGDETAGQWARYVADFGLDGRDGLLRYPVFECWGNHDGPPVGRERRGFSTQAQLVERNRRRLAAAAISRLSANGLHQSWDWDGVHFQMLGIYPADRQHDEVRYNRDWHDPQGALTFCIDDLRASVGDSGRPVVIVAHAGFDTDWWHADDWAAFHAAIAAYDVILYAFGHTGTGVWRWGPTPAAAKIQCLNAGQTTKGFFVVRITADRLRAAYRCKDSRAKAAGGWTWKFPLDVPIGGRAAVRRASAAAGEAELNPPLFDQPAVLQPPGP